MDSSGQVTTTTLPPLPPGAKVLSGGLPPLPSGAKLISDPSTATAAPASTTPAPPSVPQHQGLTGALTDNPNGEGVYQMHDQSGHVMAVPFSNVRKAAQTGMLFTDKNALRQYAKDYSAKPIDEVAVDHYLRTAPWWDAPSHVVNQLAGMGKGAVDLATHFDRTPTTQFEQNLQLAGSGTMENSAARLGEVAEGIGEFFTGDELMGIVGRGAGALAKGYGAADKLKDATQLATLLSKNPLVAKLLRVGVTAAKQGTITGSQTLAHTGDPKQAMTAAELGAGGSVLAEGAGAAGNKLLSTVLSSKPGEAEYAAEARAAAEPHLQSVSDAIDNGRATPASSAAAPAANAQRPASAPTPASSSPAPQSSPAQPVTDAVADLGPGSELAPRTAIMPGRASVEPNGQPALPGGSSGRPAALPGDTSAPAAAAPKPPAGKAINVPQILDQIHDFTGAADRLTDVNKSAYEALDRATSGKFRLLNSEVSAAQKAAWRGGPDQDAIYQNKLAEMEQLLSQTKGVSPDLLKTLKASWRQSYQLRDFGDIWDRALNGVPGSTQASQVQRGVNGNVLMNGLQRAVRSYGRSSIESALGAGRLENLENIARLNQTNALRKGFNRSVAEVARYLPIYLGARIGHEAAGLPGEIFGASAGAAIKPMAEHVLESVRANPKIGNFLTYAIDSGADPQKYGPMLAGMIADQMKQQHDQEQQGEK